MCTIVFTGTIDLGFGFKKFIEFIANTNSGLDYLKRVCRDENGVDSVKIFTVSEVNEYILDDKEVNSWMAGVKEYLLDIHGDLISHKNLVFFLETQVFLTNTNPKRSISVVVRNFIIFHCKIIEIP